MFRKLVFALLLVILLSQFAVPTVFAAGDPAGDCPPPFKLETAMQHDDHHHRHVGTLATKSGDAHICENQVPPSGKIHVHVDNTLP